MIVLILLLLLFVVIIGHNSVVVGSNKALPAPLLRILIDFDLWATHVSLTVSDHRLEVFDGAITARHIVSGESRRDYVHAAVYVAVLTREEDRRRTVLAYMRKLVFAVGKGRIVRVHNTLLRVPAC